MGSEPPADPIAAPEPNPQGRDPIGRVFAWFKKLPEPVRWCIGVSAPLAAYLGNQAATYFQMTALGLIAYRAAFVALCVLLAFIFWQTVPARRRIGAMVGVVVLFAIGVVTDYRTQGWGSPAHGTIAAQPSPPPEASHTQPPELTMTVKSGRSGEVTVTHGAMSATDAQQSQYLLETIDAYAHSRHTEQMWLSDLLDSRSRFGRKNPPENVAYDYVRALHILAGHDAVLIDGTRARTYNDVNGISLSRDYQFTRLHRPIVTSANG